MMRSFRVLAFCLFITASTKAQWNTTDYKFSDPKLFGFTMFDAQFIDNNTGIAVGEQGGIARTTNGGTNWTYGAFTYVNPAGFTTKAAFNDLHFVSNTHAYAVGNNGLMAKSVDGGVNWTYVPNPFTALNRSILSCWFINNNVGYIGGEWLNNDSIPRLYRTLNGGATWDSLLVTNTGKSRVGYINNINIAPIIRDVNSKAKVINRIIFTSPTTGYISGGSASGSGNFFPRMPSVNAPTAAVNPCGLTGTTIANSGGDAALFWKFDNGQLLDYSLSKERLGYSGVNTATVVCNTTYGTITPQTQTYRAMNVYNDSVIVLMAFNNNTVVRIRTGRNDSTTNLATGLKEPGRYEVLNYPFPPLGAPPIPNPNTLFASNPYHMIKGPDNKLYTPTGTTNTTWVSSDTGRTWIPTSNMPTGRNYSGLRHFVLNFLPSGKVMGFGQGGVITDSMPGVPWNSSFVYHNPTIAGDEVDFADCNNGVVAGGSTISVTEDGAKTWIPKNRADFAGSFTSITGISYPTPARMFISANNGNIYRSIDKGTTLDPVSINGLYQMNDIQGIGMGDTVYAIGYNNTTVAAASRKATFFRSYNAGNTWASVDIVTTPQAPGTTAPTLRRMSFANGLVGYAVGLNNSIYRTTDGGTTWTRVAPFPTLNQSPTGFTSASVTYTGVYAVDNNTVVACGNMFTSVNNRRIYKSTDQGNTWTDISGNLPSLIEIGNLNDILFHDANNGYVCLPGGVVIRTNNGGTLWTAHLAPSGLLTEGLGFAPRIAPAGTNMINRRLFAVGFAVPGGGNHILEFGNPANITINSTETIVPASCTQINGGSITVNATGGLAPYSYSLNGGAFQASNLFSGLATGTYTLRMRTNACDTLLKTVTVGFNDNLTLTTSNDTSACAGAPVPLLATATTGSSYSWSPAGGLSATNIANPVAINSAATAYTVTATLNGCTRNRIINIGIRPNPVIDAGADRTIIVGDAIMLTGSSTTTPINISWTPNTSITSANSFNPTVNPTNTTNYTLTVRDLNNCTSTDAVLVTVLPYCVNPLRAFSPNGDGFNDRWLCTNGTCANKVEAVVYNRYGKEVFKSSAYGNNWDGTYKGQPLPDGTYYFVATYYLINNTKAIVKGDLTILR
jgi:gliding motility-associated-like protein